MNSYLCPNCSGDVYESCSMCRERERRERWSDNTEFEISKAVNMLGNLIHGTQYKNLNIIENQALHHLKYIILNNKELPDLTDDSWRKEVEK